jgi:hypothetical protein
MTAGSQAQPPRAADDGYWLRNCTGFSVYSPEGRIGVVDGIVEFDGEATFLTVRSGLFRSSSHLVDAVEVAEVVPRQMRVIVGPLQ